MKIIYFFGIITILFVIYSEYSVGSILFRPNSTGKISMNLYSLFGFLIHPLYNRDLWTWQTLDINYPFVISYSLILFLI
jgi:hypothetical protein